MKLLVLLGLAAASAASPTLSPAWFGTWALDRAASRFRGELITIKPAPGGFLFDLGAATFVIKDDGRFHATVASRETSLTKLAPDRWRRVHRINGVDVDVSILTVAPSTILTIVTHRPGAAQTTERLHRVGEGSGLAGVWRSEKLGVNAAPTLTLSHVEGGAVQWGSAEEGNFYVAQVGGPPAPNQGPTSAPGVTFTLRANGPVHFTWIESLNGLALNAGQDSLSVDGRTLTEVRWPAKAPTETQTLVYRRGP